MSRGNVAISMCYSKPIWRMLRQIFQLLATGGKFVVVDQNIAGRRPIKEMPVEIHDMFKKSSLTQETSFISSQSQKSTNCSDMDQFMSLAESLHSKLCALKDHFEQIVKCLRD